MSIEDFDNTDNLQVPVIRHMFATFDPALPGQMLIGSVPIGQVESESAEDLFELQSRKPTRVPLR